MAKSKFNVRTRRLLGRLQKDALEDSRETGQKSTASESITAQHHYIGNEDNQQMNSYQISIVSDAVPLFCAQTPDYKTLLSFSTAILTELHDGNTPDNRLDDN